MLETWKVVTIEERYLVTENIHNISIAILMLMPGFFENKSAVVLDKKCT